MNSTSVEINNIKELANLLINKKTTENPVFIESQHFANTKELFFFCVELTTAILSIKFGDEFGVVKINTLTLPEFNNIKEILLNAAIDLKLDITDCDYDSDISSILYGLPTDNRNLLSDYEMIIQNSNKKYVINFNIIIFN